MCVCGGAPAWSKSSVTKRRSPWTDVQSQLLSLSEATDWSRGGQEGSDTEGERNGRDKESKELEKQMKRVGGRWEDHCRPRGGQRL